MDDSFRQLLEQSRRLLERMGVQAVDIEKQMFDVELWMAVSIRFNMAACPIIQEGSPHE